SITISEEALTAAHNTEPELKQELALEAALRESLFFSYLGRGLGTYHDQDERAPALRCPGDPQRARICGRAGAESRSRVYQTGELLHFCEQRNRFGQDRRYLV